MTIISTDNVTTLLGIVWGFVTANAVGFLTVVGALTGIALLMSFIDMAISGRVDNSHRGFNGRYLP